jgi:7-cyano-7-deazaguanine synthase
MLADSDGRGDALAVLVSGGLDSGIVLGDALRRHPIVIPLYIRCGLHYEPIELQYLKRYLNAIRTPALRTLHVLEMPAGDLYGQHWSIVGQGVPAAGTPDEAVFLPGRNVLLLAKAMLWCHLHGIKRIALGSLSSNPFPDATPAFFADFQSVVNRAVHGDVEVQLPLAGLAKTEVMQRGRDLPLEHTFSCIQPSDFQHCGSCNKCGERRAAFAQAGLEDRTVYRN